MVATSHPPAREGPAGKARTQMSVVPRTLAEQIAWYQARIAAWTSNSTAIGLTSGQATSFSGFITTAATKLTAQTAAYAAAKNSTVDLKAAGRIMNEYGSDLLKQIRAKAGQVGGDSVYVLA